MVQEVPMSDNRQSLSEFLRTAFDGKMEEDKLVALIEEAEAAEEGAARAMQIMNLGNPASCDLVEEEMLGAMMEEFLEVPPEGTLVPMAVLLHCQLCPVCRESILEEGENILPELSPEEQRDLQQHLTLLRWEEELGDPSQEEVDAMLYPDAAEEQ